MKKQNLVTTLVVAALLSVSGIGIAAETGTQAPGATAPASGTMGMHGMMQDCPMMAGENVLNPKQRMQMHAEMMRAMGEIMQKYLDDAPVAAK